MCALSGEIRDSQGNTAQNLVDSSGFGAEHAELAPNWSALGMVYCLIRHTTCCGMFGVGDQSHVCWGSCQNKNVVHACRLLVALETFECVVA